MSLAKDIKQKFEGMQSRRKSWDSDLQDVADFFNPNDNQIIVTEQVAEKRHDDLYDQSGIIALDTFTAGMYSNNTRPNDRWFAVASSDKNLREDDEASQWFNEVTTATFNAIADSNFYTQIQNVYQALGWVGRSVIMAMPGQESLLNYATLHFSESYIDEGENGIVDTLYNNFNLTARQAVQRYGEENLSSDIVKASKGVQSANDQFAFVHAIFPRTDRDITRVDNRNMAYASVTIEVKDERVVRDSGFREKPFAAPRFWKDTKEIEGRSPAMRALDSVKSLNSMMLTTLQRASWDADPLWLIPDDDSVTELNTHPGGRLFYRPNQLGTKPEIMQSGGRYELMEFLFQRIEKIVNKAFFVDFFSLLEQLPPQTQRTFGEIQER